MSKRDLESAAKLIRKRAHGTIDLAMILGSGLGAALAHDADRVALAYENIPGMPRQRALGHAGVAHIGSWGSQQTLIFAGRPHLYQGYEPNEVIYPVRLAAAAGARAIIITNAAGGLNTGFAPGDLMLITDQINFTGTSVPIAKNDPNPFIDMVDAYTPRWCRRARRSAAAAAVALREGTYVGVRGPAYESPAEISFYRAAGGDAIGMSTVLETIAARSCGLEVLGLSIISNIWHDGAATSHADVLATTARASADAFRFLDALFADFDA